MSGYTRVTGMWPIGGSTVGCLDSVSECPVRLQLLPSHASCAFKRLHHSLNDPLPAPFGVRDARLGLAEGPDVRALGAAISSAEFLKHFHSDLESPR